ncbi:GspE/PulE family protein [Alkalimonas sp. MEB108]|uniref:GspE/PulE family protein n=1 Tax=Alkalimonas cellulosilytica TaxID=3058395 RepID=A0ABU7J5A5_9GAMM|nr:GspE/PulE family protein [Alkalimonas sp. MEB108]MEE2001518.1 GspE/PulE family protein [Alkalimonas sp. MEB108]
MSELTATLMESFHIPAEDVQKALQYQQRNGGRLEQILVRMGAFSTELLPAYYARLLQLSLLSDSQYQQLLDDTDWPARTRQQLSSQQLHALLEKHWLPVYASCLNGDTTLTLLSASPAEIDGLERVSLLFGDDLPAMLVATEEQCLQLQQRLQDEPSQSSDGDLSLLEEDRLRELASEAPTVNLLNNLIAKGLRRRASDMHIEPWKGKGRVRYRIDGVLQEADSIPMNLLLPVVTRLKLLSKMDIAEKRRPQDGKIEMRVDGRSVDIRVSALPVGEGESVVMRFLLQDALSYDIGTLGIEPDIEQLLLQDLQATSGVILMTGPTGSGKTTSLYSFLSRRNEPGVKIITIEDPVEYQLDGINQVHVQSEIGFTFANALRSVVRQDPDIIMVGEIRDKETAGIALQSALTGHLVFSTLHTNDAPSAYTRLLDLGVEPFLLSAAVKVVLAQRLVRQLCSHCSVPDAAAAEKAALLGLDWLATQQGISPDYRKAHGCEHCNHTGYRGRVAIIEYLRCDNDLRALLGHSNFLSEAARLNRERGFRNLLEDGALKAMRGQTSLEEVLRVAG